MASVNLFTSRERTVESPGPERFSPSGSRLSTLDSRLSVDGKSFARGVRGDACVPPDAPGRQCVRLQGVTYGPFAPGPDGSPFPLAKQVLDDFRRMQAIGINAVRTYHLPPEWFLSLADEQGRGVFLDIPWSKHLCFLESETVQREARHAVREAARQGSKHACLAVYSVCNEIPANVVRWHGARRVERFLGELYDEAKQADPLGLVTYANFPPTEYLDLSAFDFVTFNVYLHDLETFRRYLLRLQHLVGDKPLVLGELGMDTLRHGQLEQAQFLAGHVREALLTGLAGAIVFSWTDEWHTGGCAIEDWAFGLTCADRSPKASYHALGEVFTHSLAALVPSLPRVSVVVCTYNGARTLEQCLCSLSALDYPEYEVIVVDDGSADDTPAILDRFPNVQVICQPNRGLSVARNVGLKAATGEVVAYTDSDCFAHPDWLTHLVYQLQQTGAVAVGGPNLTAEDGWLAACVAAAPGQPAHVLESDQVAEHIPGCNMAFRRDALVAINGFDPQYRKAGDDVDVCWRLQQAGMWITFAPGAFVWHHRRQGPRAYLRQQAGYGEAEALLRFKHPDKFNGRGDGKWRGSLYGAAFPGVRLTGALIYHGTFGTGFFQCLYQAHPAHWAMLPATLEWHVGIALTALAGFFWPVAWIVAALMFGLSLAVAALQAAQARLAPRHRSPGARLLIMGLCYFQPLVRSWKRYRTRLFAYRPPRAGPDILRGCHEPLSLAGRHAVAYWTELGHERTDLVALCLAAFREGAPTKWGRWGLTIDSGWSGWDLELYCHPWTIVQVYTAQEDHGGLKRLIRVRYRLRPSGYIKGLGLVSATLVGIAIGLEFWPAAVAGLGLLGLCGGLWWRGTRRAAQVVAVVDGMARSLELYRCAPARPADDKVTR
jgi:GT2 family glycosyltransferase